VRALCLLAAASSLALGAIGAPPTATTWRLETAERVGRHPVAVLGAPKRVSTDIGPALEFNGSSDGLLLDVNPLRGLARFTIEVLFQPAPGGQPEQRFLHIEEPGTGSRALIELRMTDADRWALDTYLRAGQTGLTLLDRTRTHAAGQWHTAALVYDGRTMTHYVNGEKELSGEIAFPPIGGGRTSIGVRQNQVSWFKGRIHTIRFSPGAVAPAAMLRAPASADAEAR
jgi:hypothetical protein